MIKKTYVKFEGKVLYIEYEKRAGPNRTDAWQKVPGSERIVTDPKEIKEAFG